MVLFETSLDPGVAKRVGLRSLAKSSKSVTKLAPSWMPPPASRKLRIFSVTVITVLDGGIHLLGGWVVGDKAGVFDFQIMCLGASPDTHHSSHASGATPKATRPKVGIGGEISSSKSDTCTHVTCTTHPTASRPPADRKV